MLLKYKTSRRIFYLSIVLTLVLIVWRMNSVRIENKAYNEWMIFCYESSPLTRYECEILFIENKEYILIEKKLDLANLLSTSRNKY